MCVKGNIRGRERKGAHGRKRENQTKKSLSSLYGKKIKEEKNIYFSRAGWMNRWLER